MELSGKLKVAAVCAIGVAGSLFIGYCIYFDRKRRSHPDYKKKVIENRKKAKQKAQQTINLSDPKQREDFIVAQLELANQCMMEGNLQQSVVHFIQFVQYSGNPKASLNYLQQIVPPAIFKLILQGFAALAKAQQQEQAAAAADVD